MFKVEYTHIFYPIYYNLFTECLASMNGSVFDAHGIKGCNIL